MTAGNGKVNAEVAGQVVQEVAGTPAKQWLHPDALKPRDYLRGKVALKDVLAAADHENCYDFLGTDEMYPWLIWALKSRTNPKFTWDDALDTDFGEFQMGGDRPPPPPAEPPSSSGSKLTRPAESKANAVQPNAEPTSSSGSSTG